MNWDNIKEVQNQVKVDGLLLANASDHVKKDWNTVEIAIRQNGLALQYAGDTLRDHTYIVERAIYQNPLAFQYAGESVKKYEYLVHKVLKKNQDMLLYVSDTLKDNLLFMRPYVLKNSSNAKYLSERLKNDKELAYLTLINTKKGVCIEHFGLDVKEDEAIVLKAVQLNPAAYTFAGPILKSNPAFIAKVQAYVTVPLNETIKLAMRFKEA